MTDEAPNEEQPQAATDPKEAMTTPRGSFVSKDEQALQDASEAMHEDETKSEVSQTPKFSPAKAKKSKKKLLIILVILLAIAGVGFGVSKLLKSKPKTVDSTQGSSQSNGTGGGNDTSQAIQPDSVVYAYKDADANPFTLYYRPALGGERKESLKLNRDVYVLQHDTRGSKAAFATDDGLYISKDNGKTITQVLKLAAGEQITGIRFANSGSRLAYSTSKDLKQSSLKSVNLDGKDPQELGTIDAGGVLIYGWNDQKNKIFYSKGCANCDGSPSAYVIYDIKTKKETKVELAIAKSDYIQKVAISDDFSRIMAVNAAPETGSEVALSAGAAPYTVVSYDIGASKASEVASIGQKGEKNTNGTTKYRTILVGFVAEDSTAYYTDSTNLYMVKAGTDPSIYYTADKTILDVLFVSKNAVIASAGDTSADYSLAHFDTAKKKSTAIFQGDNNTVIVGVTSK